MGEVTDLQSIEQELESLVRAAADLFKAHCSLERENHLLLTFQLFPDFLRLTFDFQGKLCRLEELETALKHVLQKREDSFELREEECVFSVCFEKK